MKRNMGNLDRLIRAVVGLALVVVGIVLMGWWWIATGVGVIMLITAALAWCPLYVPFKISTYRK